MKYFATRYDIENLRSLIAHANAEASNAKKEVIGLDLDVASLKRQNELLMKHLGLRLEYGARIVPISDGEPKPIYDRVPKRKP